MFVQRVMEAVTMRAKDYIAVTISILGFVVSLFALHQTVVGQQQNLSIEQNGYQMTMLNDHLADLSDQVTTIESCYQKKMGGSSLTDDDLAELRGVYNALSMKLDDSNQYADSLKSLMEEYLDDMGAIPEKADTLSAEEDTAISSNAKDDADTSEGSSQGKAAPNTGALGGLEDAYKQYCNAEIEIIKSKIAA